MTVTRLEIHFLTLGLLENLFVNFGAQASTAIRCRTFHPHIVLGSKYPRWSTDDMKITSHVLTSTPYLPVGIWTRVALCRQEDEKLICTAHYANMSVAYPAAAKL
jgi:hypothetical protein